MKIETINTTQWDELLSQLTIHFSSGRGPKIASDQEGNLWKFFFPRKRFFTTYWLNPHGVKFANNGKKLAERGIQAPQVDKLLYYPEQRCHIVRYKKIPGEDYRTLLNGEPNPELMNEFLEHVKALHEKGVYFRAIHLGNMLRQENHQFALVDITDVQFFNGPLPKSVRERNFKHIRESRNDKSLWEKLELVLRTSA